MRTELLLSMLVAQLQSNCGDMFEACKAVGVSLHFVNTWMKDDEKVREQITEAGRLGAMRIESEIIRRGVHGVDEPVFYKGKECGYKRVYSDGLLGKLADAKLPGYRKGEEGGGATFNGPTQINIMPRADSYEQWLTMRSATLSNRRQEALPAPDDIIDAEAIPVEIHPLEGLGL